MAEVLSLIRPVPAVSLAVFREDKVLIVQRGREPFVGSWSFPGGRLQPGERLEQAARRELAEETGLEAEDLHFVSPVEIIKRDQNVLKHHIVLFLFAARWKSGEARPADDALALRWASLEELKALHTTDGLQNYAELARQRMLGLHG